MDDSIRITFLSSGANIEAKDVDNYTPLLTAAEFGQTDVFQLLLDPTVTPRPASLNVHNMTKKSALFLAAESNHPKIIEVCKYQFAAMYVFRLYYCMKHRSGLGMRLWDMCSRELLFLTRALIVMRGHVSVPFECRSYSNSLEGHTKYAQKWT